MGRVAKAMNDYPFVIVEVCPWCGSECVAVIELIIGTPRPTGGLIRVPFEDQMTVMAACHHAVPDDE